ncbi:transcription factor atoh8 isoform X2 [Triplophysa rosa]|uniref:transcription factor atoh8 isoform X2 n=1 Tax=Triplophysa rosa TaxID=992332 RepID=UPI0025460A66|nr:transcription factor atoh8 isoform X2 [Triplophysa rosa]
MRNTLHVNDGHKVLHSVSGDKKCKRKARDPVKRDLSYFKLYNTSHPMDETLGSSAAMKTNPVEMIASRDDSDTLNTAIDMRINTEKTVDNSAKTSAQVSVLNRPQVFVLSQRAVSQAPASGSRSECAESPGRRAGEPSGAVTQIKAVQQTRRLLANARERTRVHTISAAFEALRKQVPCYSYGQKLSKLAILRIACNYILSLAQLAELDYSPDHGNLSFRECVEQCTRTLQAEGRSKKRKVNSSGEDIFQFLMKTHCILKGSKETAVWFYENKMENFSL